MTIVCTTHREDSSESVIVESIIMHQAPLFQMGTPRRSRLLIELRSDRSHTRYSTLLTPHIAHGVRVLFAKDDRIRSSA